MKYYHELPVLDEYHDRSIIKCDKEYYLIEEKVLWWWERIDIGDDLTILKGYCKTLAEAERKLEWLINEYYTGEYSKKHEKRIMREAVA